jgi:uncharacterized protein
MLAFALCASFAACASGPRVVLKAPDGTPRAMVNVEIANTTSQREFGLMYRKHLDQDAGMIFVFPAPQRLGFWMKNTEIPLDMIFADGEGKIVGIVENAEPFSERTLGVDPESQFVLEVNGGFAQRHHIRAGDHLEFFGFLPKARD